MVPIVHSTTYIQDGRFHIAWTVCYRGAAFSKQSCPILQNFFGCRSLLQIWASVVNSWSYTPGQVTKLQWSMLVAWISDLMTSLLGYRLEEIKRKHRLWRHFDVRGTPLYIRVNLSTLHQVCRTRNCTTPSTWKNLSKLQGQRVAL